MTAAQLAAKKAKGDEEQDVNIDQLIDDLKKDIFHAYYNKDYRLGEEADLESKSAIQLLHEIELKVVTKMNEIEYIQNAEKHCSQEEKHSRAAWLKILEKQEAARKEARFNEQKRIRDEAERAKKEKVQRNLDDRMNRKVKKVGKQDMYRSQKPKVKQEVKKKVIDEETQDQILYLGGDLKTLAEQALANAASGK